MISIIIPTLNEEKYIPYLLSSIKKQSFKNYEIIIADANSKDRTKEIASKNGCCIIEGGLPAVGRNKGAEIAEGDLLLFLDADVILPKDFLKNALKEFNQRWLDVASCFILPLSDKKIDDLLYGCGNLYYQVNQYFQPQAPGYCILIEKELHKKINGFNEKIKLAEDWDYVTRASKNGKFRFLRNVKIPLSMRRFERDGRSDVALKRLIGAVYFSLFGGIKLDSKLSKHYHFGNYPDKALKPTINNYSELLDQIRNKFKN